MGDLFNIGFFDILDILIIAFLITRLYKLIKGTSSFYIVLSIVSMYIMLALSNILNMHLLSSILEQVTGVGVIALIVVFQQEVRRFLVHFGNKYLSKQFFHNVSTTGVDNKFIDEIVSACQSMSDTYTGALIVLAKSDDMQSIMETGDIIETEIHRQMIESIFYKNAPLHDGAMIISKGKIRALRCVLPSTERLDIPAYYGMRHKAAIGLTESSDATVVVVSEQTGKISYVAAGKINRGLTAIQLKELLLNENK